MLRAVFVRTVGERDRIYVTRSDGSELSWAFPSYGDAPPHDLVHLVVESAFGLARGFWGRVDAGADPGRIQAEANRRGGAKKYAAYGEDQRELQIAEALAAASWSEADDVVAKAIRASYARFGVEAPPEPTAARIRETREALGLASRRWRALLPKGSLTAPFHRDRPRRGFEELCRELTGVGHPARAG